jgi:hypothetical protein
MKIPGMKSEEAVVTTHSNTDVTSFKNKKKKSVQSGMGDNPSP